MQVNNRQCLFVFIVVILMFLNVSIQTTFAKDYIDVSDNHKYANDSLEQLIEVYAYDQNYDQEEAQQMINRIGEIPEIVIEAVLLKGARLIFVDFPITDLEEFAYLHGEHPRGHDDFVVWDDIPGAGGQVTAARIGYSEPGMDHGSINLEYHEFGHAIEYALFDGEIVVNNDDFYNIYLAEKDTMFPGNEYMDYPEEYFAESLAYFYSGGYLAEELLDNAPQTFDFIDKLSTFVLHIVNHSDEGIVLNWGTDETIERYEVYRDGDLLDVTEASTYTDITFTEHDFHSYQIYGINKSDEIVQKTIFADVFTDDNVAMDITSEDDFSVDEIDDSMVKLNWDKVGNAIYYELYRDGDLIAETKETYVVDDEIESNSTYTYVVKAYNVNETSVQYPEITVRTLSVNPFFGLNATSLLIGFGMILILSVGIVIILHRRKK